jgi:hypothetical protein
MYNRSLSSFLQTKDTVATRIAEADTVRLSTEHLQSEPLSQSSSIGALMLRKMGWTGGGIGRSEQVCSDSSLLIEYFRASKHRSVSIH